MNMLYMNINRKNNNNGGGGGGGGVKITNRGLSKPKSRGQTRVVTTTLQQEEE